MRRFGKRLWHFPHQIMIHVLCGVYFSETSVTNYAHVNVSIAEFSTKYLLSNSPLFPINFLKHSSKLDQQYFDYTDTRIAHLLLSLFHFQINFFSMMPVNNKQRREENSTILQLLVCGILINLSIEMASVARDEYMCGAAK